MPRLRHELINLRRKSVHWLGSRQKDQFAELQTSMTAALADTIRSQMSALPRFPVAFEEAIQRMHAETVAQIKEEHEKTRAQTLAIGVPLKSALKSSAETPGILSEPETNVLMAEGYATKLADLESKVLESLSFPVMWDREEDIAPAELATFDWIFKDPRSIDRPWSNFQEWLKSGQSIYWINGKAGSGKSTLMKHLLHHPRTKKALKSWADRTDLIVASFFFWNRGSELQKSQDGLLRSLLYECLRGRRELLPLVLPDTVTNDLLDYWTLPRLKAAFIRLIQQETVALRICLFVDGLDEYSGEHSGIAELFKSTACHQHVKFCLSSRPLLVFDRAFQPFPGLVLQNLTFDDIRIYVRTRLSVHERMKEVELEEPGISARLASEIVTKASGVFLWVKLVVNSLLDGLGNFDRGTDLERRLGELPEDLENLYWHMIDRVKPVWYLEEGFRLLLLVKAAIFNLRVLQLCFADMQVEDFALKCKMNELDKETMSRLCKAMAGRIKTRCLGMIEISGDVGPESKELGTRRVSFLHKSVVDFLETPRAQHRITASLGKQAFVPETRLVQSGLLELKMVQRSIFEHFDPLVPQGPKRETWFDEIRPIIVECIEYAKIAEETTHQADVCLLDEINRVAECLWTSITFKSEEERAGTIHWSAAPRRPRGSLTYDPADTEDTTKLSLYEDSPRTLGLFPSTSSSARNSSKEKDTNISRNRELESLAELKVAVKIIEQSRESSANQTTEEAGNPSQHLELISPDDSDNGSDESSSASISVIRMSILKKGSLPTEEPLVVHFAESELDLPAPNWDFQAPTRKQRLMQHYSEVPVELKLGQKRLELLLAPNSSPSHVTSFEEFVEFLGLRLYVEAKREERGDIENRMQSPLQAEERPGTTAILDKDIRDENVSPPEEAPKPELKETSSDDGKQAPTLSPAVEDTESDTTNGVGAGSGTVPEVGRERKKTERAVAKLWQSIVGLSRWSRVSR